MLPLRKLIQVSVSLIILLLCILVQILYIADPQIFSFILSLGLFIVFYSEFFISLSGQELFAWKSSLGYLEISGVFENLPGFLPLRIYLE